MESSKILVSFQFSQMMDFWLLVSCYHNNHPVLDWACKGHISAYSPQKICGPVSLRQPPQEVWGAPTCLGSRLCLFEAIQLWADCVYVRTHSLSCALSIGSPKLHVNTRRNQASHLPPSCKHSTTFSYHLTKHWVSQYLMIDIYHAVLSFAFQACILTELCVNESQVSGFKPGWHLETLKILIILN